MDKVPQSHRRKSNKYRCRRNVSSRESTAPRPPKRRESLGGSVDSLPQPSTRRGVKKPPSKFLRQHSSTGSSKKVKRVGKPWKIQRRKIILLVLILLISTAVGVSLYLFLPPYISECSNLELPPEYRAIVCARLQAGRVCDFNSDQCQVDCPLGLETDEYACVISCDCATKGVFESDVAYDENSLQALLSAYMTEEDHSIQLFSGSATNVLNLWNRIKVGPSVRVPYVLSSDLDSSVVNGINAAIDALSNETCVEFVLRTNEPDYIVFKSGLGCSSPVSRLGGEQYIHLSKECNAVGSVLHEMLHALGFWHEHSRPDRDDHVMIQWANIAKDNHHHFNTRSAETLFDFGSPYDKSSVLHGSGYSFSKDLTSASMIDLTTDDVVKIQRARLSKEDLYETNALYECSMPYTGSTSGAQWGFWSKLGLCSVTCGSGTAYRLRECKNDKKEVVPRRFCGSDYFQEESCNIGPCEMGLWGPWSPCDLTCGTGTRKRISCCGRNSTTEIESCIDRRCSGSAEAFWADWQEWGECLRTCGNGLRRRYRACFDVFNTKIESLRCPQVGTSHLGIEICAPNACPRTDPPASYWSVWSVWGECSRTCGVGTYKRFRQCLTIKGTKAYHCVGDTIEVSSCNVTQCAELSVSLWTPWSPWSVCSATCDGGSRKRERKCQTSGELTIENDCGESMELVDKEIRTETCRNEPCNPDTTMWGDWESWGECNKQCDGGIRWRLRLCVGGNYGHAQCPWDGIYSREKCNEDPCSPAEKSSRGSSKSLWGPWAQWGTCTLSCNGGWTKRFRLCETLKNKMRTLAFDCVLPNNSTSSKQIVRKKCGTQVCESADATWHHWESWSECTASCGNGIKKRKRMCIDGKKCEGTAYDYEPCSSAACPRYKTRSRKRRSNVVTSTKLAYYFGLKSSQASLRAHHRKPQRNDLLCANGQIFHADFNGDGEKDRLCLERGRQIKIAYGMQMGVIAKVDWERRSDFCSDAVDLVYVFDFNVDSAADLMCYNKKMRSFTIMYAKHGRFDGRGGKHQGHVSQEFCELFGLALHAANVRGDHPCREDEEVAKPQFRMVL